MLFAFGQFYKLRPSYEASQLVQANHRLCDPSEAMDVLRVAVREPNCIRHLTETLYENNLHLNALTTEDILEFAFREISSGRWVLVRLYDPRDDYHLGHLLNQLPSFPSPEPTPPSPTTTFIAYHLTYLDGTPAANLTCFVTHPNGSKQRINSDAQGRIDLRAIPEGDYTLEAVPPGSEPSTEAFANHELEHNDGDDNSEEDEDGHEESNQFEEDNDEESLIDDDDFEDSLDKPIEPHRRQALADN